MSENNSHPKIPADYLPNQEPHYREAAWRADRDAEAMHARYNARQDAAAAIAECADDHRAVRARLHRSF